MYDDQKRKLSELRTQLPIKDQVPPLLKSVEVLPHYPTQFPLRNRGCIFGVYA